MTRRALPGVVLALSRTPALGLSRALALALALALAVALGLAVASPAAAQLSGSTLLLAQNGNLPDIAPGNRLGAYSQTSLVAPFPHGQAGLRFEAQRTSGGDPSYARVTQRFLDLREPEHGLHLRLGTLTATMGRGLTLRAFELPGVVLEDAGARTQHAFSRDIDGALVEVTGRTWSLRGLTGSPVFAEAPRDLAVDRYPPVSAAEAAWRPREGVRGGATYARLTSTPRDIEAVSGFLDLDPLAAAGRAPGVWTVYAEYAARGRRFGNWWSLSTARPVPHALYASTSVVTGPLTLTLEAKGYSQFRLGVNDPPSLVRQHTAALLNRATHILEADDETGFQSEASWAAPHGVTLLANWSQALGHVSAGRGRERTILFDERYAEVMFAPAGDLRWSGTLFGDRQRDDLLGERHTTWGGTATFDRLPLAWTAEAERAASRRHGVIGGDVPYTDLYLSLSASWSGRASAGLVCERSDDPTFADRADTPTIETGARSVLGATGSATLSSRTELRAFAGERRGGTACTAGSCYLVPAFRGVELTWISRF